MLFHPKHLSPANVLQMSLAKCIVIVNVSLSAVQEQRSLFCSLMYPKGLGQCLAHGRHYPIFVEWISKNDFL